MAEVIRLEDIMKTYVMGDTILHALNHVHLEVTNGRIYGYHGTFRQR
jgi:ABC-type methionine transport system ATPase subunit